IFALAHLVTWPLIWSLKCPNHQLTRCHNSLLDDGLLHRVLEVTLQRSARALHHDDRDELLFGIHILVGPVRAGPAVSAWRHTEVGGDRVEHDLDAEPKAHSVRGTPELAVDHVAGVIRRHELHGFWAEIPPAIQH